MFRRNPHENRMCLAGARRNSAVERRACRHVQDEDRLLQQLRRQFLASGDAEELGQGHPEGGQGGVVAAADIFTTADKEVPTQAAQIQNLILQGYNAIVINAASPDALNGAIKQACDAGIVVVSFDGIVTEPCAYRVAVDFKAMGHAESTTMAKFQPKGGNLLEIRGLAGTSIDDEIQRASWRACQEHPSSRSSAP